MVNEIGWEGVDCIHVVQDRGCCECDTDCCDYIQCREFLKKDS